MALDIGRIVGDSYNMLFRNGTVLKIGIMIAVISALLAVTLNIVMAPLVALQTAAPLSTPTLPDLSTIIATAVSVLVTFTAIALMAWLISIFFSGALLSAASVGDKADLGSSFSRAKSRYLSLLGTSIICGLVVLAFMIPGFVIMVIGALLSGLVGVGVLILGVVVLVVLISYAAFKLWIADAACVVGGYGAVESVKRSWNLTTGNYWRIFAIVLIIGLISGIAGRILNFLISLINPTAGSFVGSFVQAIMAIPVSVAIVLVYIQLSEPVNKAGPAKMQKPSR